MTDVPQPPPSIKPSAGVIPEGGKIQLPREREWFVIEDSRKYGVFATAEMQSPRGYIPRDTAERVLGRDLGGTVWFTAEESALMRASPEWRDAEP